MARVIPIPTDEQRKGMHSIMVGKGGRVKGKDCAYCRNSKLELVAEKLTYVCKRGYIAVAAGCPDFRDSRVALCANFSRTL